MTTGEMLVYTDRFKNITESTLSNQVKDTRLASLMTDLEHVYGIPMIRNEQFEQENPCLMQLYRTVSMERSFD